MSTRPGLPPHTGPGIERSIIRGIVGAAVLLIVARTKADADLWGHVRFGGDILRGGIPSSDPYSFTSDIPWVNHEWLAEVVMWLAWAVGGGAGLVALKMAIVTAVVAMAWRVLRVARLRPVAMEWLLLLVVLGTWPRTSVVRPQLFSILLFAVLLWILQSVDRGKLRRGYWLPFVFAAWINLHGGWIVGFGVFGAWLAFGLVTRSSAMPWRTGLMVAGLCAAALLVNPYGWRMLGFIADTVRIDRADITDWQPIRQKGLLFWLWCGSALTALWVLLRKRTALPLFHVAIVLGLGIGAWRISRLDAFFAMAVVILFGPHLGARGGPGHGAPVRWRPAAFIPGVVTALAFLGASPGQSVACIGLDVAWAPERQAGAFIEANALKGRLLSWYDWGEYVIWHFGPSLSVSLDGRRETVYSDSLLKEHYALYDEPEQNLSTLERLNPDYAWLPTTTRLVPALEARGWARLFSGPTSVILARRPAPLITPAPPEGVGCFPGP